MSEPIVFFGSGPVAAKSLELLAEWADIEAVITKPQPPHHKEPFPVLVVAKKLGIKTFTPNGKAELSELFAGKPVKSRLGLVIDYGFIINQDVIDCFQLGIVNSHFSLLPQWRGADPISFAILSGQKETGVSLMLIVEKMDEGPLLAFGVYEMNGAETTPSLTEHLIQLSDALLRNTLPRYIDDPKTIDQSDITEQFGRTASYSRKLTKDDGILDWNKPAEQLEREIRAFQEWPKSRTTLAGKDVIVTKAHAVASQAPDAKPGDIEAAKEAGVIIVGTSKGSLCIETLKPAGKPEMAASAFLAGNRLV